MQKLSQSQDSLGNVEAIYDRRHLLDAFELSDMGWPDSSFDPVTMAYPVVM
ncbi:MAG TPA: hypothetical protein VG206_02785 [Terriglobia bacterium]|nr:hypothetical protein [Terriglobia bacterium]